MPLKITITCAFCGAGKDCTSLRSASRSKYCSVRCRDLAFKARSSPEEFLERVEKTESCWIWIGPKSHGYGRYRNQIAPRYSWKIHRGEIPDGLWVLHNCPGGDNPACVNPNHLYLGTCQDNTQDAYNKGQLKPPWLGKKRPYNTMARGSQISKILTEPDIVKIRGLATSGIPRREIAAMFGIALENLHKIIQRKSWGHVP